MKNICAIALAILVCPTAFAFDMPVEVSHTGDDLVGKRLVYFLKDGIQKSSSLRLTSENEPRVQIRIISIEDGNLDPGISSVYSVSWLLNDTVALMPYYLASNVGYCGSDRAKYCAESLVVTTHTGRRINQGCQNTFKKPIECGIAGWKSKYTLARQYIGMLSNLHQSNPYKIDQVISF